MKSIPFSVLDLAPISSGSDAGAALANTRDLAQHAEKWGYHRYWLAEHHNMPGIASAATAVVIGNVAEHTSTIRLGSGGIMLPNHSPLVIAEQFGTLATLYPGRIDLGVGRAPGTDQVTASALRRDRRRVVENFETDVVELLSYFENAAPAQRVHAIPGQGLHVPVWILGSSTFGAMLAASLGLPFAFASHFAPEQMHQAIHLYRENFQPTDSNPQPYIMLGINAVAAETDQNAQFLFTSIQQQFTNLRRGTPTKLPPPVESMDGRWSPAEEENAARTLSTAIVGSPKTVRNGLESFISSTQPDEIILTAHIHNHGLRLRSFEIIADIYNSMALTVAA